MIYKTFFNIICIYFDTIGAGIYIKKPNLNRTVTVAWTGLLLRIYRMPSTMRKCGFRIDILLGYSELLGYLNYFLRSEARDLFC